MFPIQKKNTIEHLIADLGYKLETQVNLKMPVFKIWNADRNMKKMVVATTIEELKDKGKPE